MLANDMPTPVLRRWVAGSVLLAVAAARHLHMGTTADLADAVWAALAAGCAALAGFMMFGPLMFLMNRWTGRSVPDGRGQSTAEINKMTGHMATMAFSAIIRRNSARAPLVAAAAIAAVLVLLAGLSIHYVGYDPGWFDVIPALPGHALAHVLDALAPVGNVDNSEPDLRLNAARDIDVFELSGMTYAAVAAYDDHTVQIIDITDPANPTYVDHMHDTLSRKLGNAIGIDVFNHSGHTYAAVAAFNDGVQILNLTDPSNIERAGELGDTTTRKLQGAWGIDAFELSGMTYAAVTSDIENGVQILNLTDLPSISTAGQIVNNATLKLNKPRGIDVFEMSGMTYAAVTAYNSRGVQILDLTGLPDIKHVDNIVDASGMELAGAIDIDVFKMSGHTYAAVAADTDSGVQILNLTDPYDISAAGKIGDGGGLLLNRAFGIDVFNQSGFTYAAVASRGNNGVQILNLTGLPDITAVANIGDTSNLELDGAWGIDVFSIGGLTYAGVAASDDDGVQILGINLHATNSPPTANAGRSLLVDEDTTVRLRASAADPDGDPLTYLWTYSPTLESNPPLIISNTTILNPTITAPDVSQVSSYTVTLNVTDHHGAFSTDTMNFNVQDNRRPLANAGDDQTVAGRSTVRLDGSASDKNGDPLTYLWTHNSTLSITLSNSTVRNPTFIAPFVSANTTILFTLNVTDHHGASHTDDVHITVTPVANNPPTVDAFGALIFKLEGHTTELFATASDPDANDPLTYLWTHNYTQPIGIDDDTALVTNATMPHVNEYTVVKFTITVTDSQGASASDYVILNVENNTRHMVDAGRDLSVSEGTVAALTCRISDKNIFTQRHHVFEWTHNSTLPINIVENPRSGLFIIDVTAPLVDAPTPILFTCTVDDNDGIVVSDSMVLTVQDPTEYTVDAGRNVYVNEGDTATLSGTATREFVNLLHYKWTCTPSIDMGAADELTVSFTAPQVDRDTTYECKLTARDQFGRSIFDTANLVVLDVPPDRPVLNIIGEIYPTIIQYATWTDPKAICITLHGSIPLDITTTGSVDTSTIGSYDITYTCAGISKTRTVTVIPAASDQHPTINIIHDRGAIASGLTDPDFGDDAVCTDREDGDISHTITATVSYSGSTATITYACTDSGGHTVTDTNTVGVIPDADTDDGTASPNSPPQIDVIGGTIHVNVGDDITDPGATCTDVEDGTWTVNATNYDDFDTSTAGHYYLVYICTDDDGATQASGGARSVFVVAPAADTAPTLTISDTSDIVIPVNGTWSEPVVTCTDKEDGDISFRVTSNGVHSVDVSKPGTYHITYFCTDSANNQVQAGVSVVVEAGS